MSPPAADLGSSCYYGVLGVDKSATNAEITRAYRKLALKHYPGKNPDDKERAEDFKRITEAYAVLRNPEKRQAYNQFGKAAFDPGQEGPRSAGGTYAAGGRGMSSKEAERIFRAVFGGGDEGSATPGCGVAAGMACGEDSGLPLGSRDSDFAGTAFGGSSGSSMPAHAVPQGTKVVVRGLGQAAWYNGKKGVVVSWDGAKRRHEVRLVGGCCLMLKPRNLTQLCHLELTGLAAKPELNEHSARSQPVTRRGAATWWFWRGRSRWP